MSRRLTLEVRVWKRPHPPGQTGGAEESDFDTEFTEVAAKSDVGFMQLKREQDPRSTLEDLRQTAEGLAAVAELIFFGG